MKLIIILLLLLNVNLFANPDTSVNSNISYSSSFFNGDENPAALPFKHNKDTRVVVGFEYEDEVHLSNFSNNITMPYINNPTSGVNFSLFSEGIAFDLSYISDYTNRVNNLNSFAIDNSLKFDLDISLYKLYNNLSVGAKTNFLIKSDTTFNVSSLGSLILEPFKSNENKTTLALSVGAIYKQDSLSLAYTIDELFKIENSALTEYDKNKMLSSMKFGIAYNLPQYDKFGVVNTMNGRVGLQLVSLNTLDLSTETIIQLNNVSYLSTGVSISRNFSNNKNAYSVNAVLETSRVAIEVETYMFRNLRLSFSYLF